MEEKKTHKKHDGKNPKLRWKKLAGGMSGAYLEFYMGCVDGKPVQRKVSLGLTRYDNPTKKWQVKKNEEVEEEAENIRALREEEFMSEVHGFETPARTQSLNFLDFMEGYIDGYTKKDKGVMKSTLRRFRLFLSEHFGRDVKVLTAFQVNEELVRDFANWCKKVSKGEGAQATYKRFKKMLRAAAKSKVLRYDPSSLVETRELNLTDESTKRKKETLDVSEIKKLLATDCPPGVRPAVCDAFTLCLFTGMRFCDVSALTFANVDYKEKKLRFKQSKTGAEVTPPLDDNLLSLIGKPEGKSPDDLVFDLPPRAACVSDLAKWVNAAGITKHITWHCARHTVGTILAAEKNVALVTVASILGHANTLMTERYVDTDDKPKRKALAKMPTSFINPKSGK